MNVVFLDYDGVVNTAMWDAEGKHCRYNFSWDNSVNNFQSVQWVSEFCEQCGYDIVVSSTWRLEKNYIDCLKNGGLRSGINVIGKTPFLLDGTRGDEIRAYLSSHPEVEKFLIFDDDNDMDDLEDHLIKCNPHTGFGVDEFCKAVKLDEKMQREMNREVHT